MRGRAPSAHWRPPARGRQWRQPLGAHQQTARARLAVFSRARHGSDVARRPRRAHVRRPTRRTAARAAGAAVPAPERIVRCRCRQTCGDLADWRRCARPCGQRDSRTAAAEAPARARPAATRALGAAARAATAARSRGEDAAVGASAPAAASPRSRRQPRITCATQALKRSLSSSSCSSQNSLSLDSAFAMFAGAVGSWSAARSCRCIDDRPASASGRRGCSSAGSSAFAAGVDERDELHRRVLVRRALQDRPVVEHVDAAVPDDAEVLARLVVGRGDAAVVGRRSSPLRPRRASCGGCAPASHHSDARLIVSSFLNARSTPAWWRAPCRRRRRARRRPSARSRGCTSGPCAAPRLPGNFFSVEEIGPALRRVAWSLSPS